MCKREEEGKERKKSERGMKEKMRTEKQNGEKNDGRKRNTRKISDTVTERERGMKRGKERKYKKTKKEGEMKRKGGYGSKSRREQQKVIIKDRRKSNTMRQNKRK